jgi:hypothetical protein
MLNTVVRKLFRYLGVHELSENDVINVIRVMNLDKLNPGHIFLLSSILPVLELIIKYDPDLTYLNSLP